jgi:hypothetical protein
MRVMSGRVRLNGPTTRPDRAVPCPPNGLLARPKHGPSPLPIVSSRAHAGPNRVGCGAAHLPRAKF